ncbi:MAG: sigma-70 family RNA polymerase sigma factor [Deltaproteobacteria bacterium]|nr:sigma-70 family RNA polymerase sigma factor [Deltaproteobacteria bacterium]MCW5802905.1 sigma-70 family RNA polymerase sigma factor [Deltaproteobacteria bacterium]
MSASEADVTALLGRVRDGDARARAELFPVVYRDLEQIAAAYVQRGGATLEPRGLVHELYLRLAGASLEARDRKHFFAIAALAMRQILVDRARRRRSDKRGGDAVRVTLSGLRDPGDDDLDLLAVEQALEKLEALSERQARIVELRCLVGLTVAEVAEALDVSERTVHADWRLARAWLTRELAAHG